MRISLSLYMAHSIHTSLTSARQLQKHNKFAIFKKINIHKANPIRRNHIRHYHIQGILGYFPAPEWGGRPSQEGKKNSCPLSRGDHRGV